MLGMSSRGRQSGGSSAAASPKPKLTRARRLVSRLHFSSPTDSPYGDETPRDHAIDAYMTSLFARLGPLDTQRGLQTIWHKQKRQGKDWICSECRAKRASRQRRAYSDDAISLPGGSYLFPPRDDTRGDARDNRRHASSKPQNGWSSWGLRASDTQAPGEKADNASRWLGSRKGDAFFSQHEPSSSDTTGSAVDRQDQEHENLWEEFEAADGATTIADDANRMQAVSPDVVKERLGFTSEDSMLDFDYRKDLSIALAKGESDHVIRCLFAANQADDLDWLRSIPSGTFSEIIRLLAPSNFIAKLANAHIELSTVMAEQLGVAPMRQIAFEYTTVLRQVIAIRRAAGVKLSLDDYTILLRSARDLGNSRMAFTMWTSLLNEGLTPDTKCYNYYMSSVLWNGVHSAGSKQYVRVIPFNMLGRQQSRPKSRFRNYRTGSGGVRESAMKIFNDMLAHGATADEESFRVLITACAREGDMKVVMSILKKVWNIDVRAILEGQDEAKITPRRFPEHSSLQPTSALLFAISHAFGINNDIPAALRTVDFVARHYDISMPDKVWSQLFEWTFVLSADRWGKQKTDGSMTGQLHFQSLLSLWDTMTGHPYYVQPSMGMYNRLIKNLFQFGWTEKIVERMREGEKLYGRHRFEAYEAMRRLKGTSQRTDDGEQDVSLEQLRTDWETADLIRQRDYFWLKRWLRLLLGSFRQWHKRDHSQQLFCRVLPPLLWEWRVFAPPVVFYETPTGFVEFAIRTKEEMLENAKVLYRKHESVQRLLQESKRYVGDRWVRGRNWDPPKRLRRHRREYGSM